MASGSSKGGNGSSSRRKGAQSRLSYKQMQANKGKTRSAARRMRINRNNNSIPF